jgi:BA14K-like protein
MLKHSLIALAAMGAGLIGFSASEASAFSVQKPLLETSSESSLLVDVKHREWKKRHHGSRHHRRSHRHRHYHGGYWYENPWWVFPMIGAGIALGSRDHYYDRGYGSRHVEWCLNRYRSYNIRTNTWVSYDGRVRYCNSPYS